MTPELKWLALTALLSTVMWLPYIVNLILVRGLVNAMGYPADPKPIAPWAQRLKCAHYNAVENLVVFAIFVFIAHLADIHSKATVMACTLFFWSRLAYTIIYAFGIPVLRTLVFFGSWACILTMAAAILL
ncbi:MAG: MAPEG family protein [Pseudomonadota bacterium]